MFSKAKTVIAAAFVLGTATAAFAQSGEEFQNSQYQLNPNAAVPIYAQTASQPQALIEGRNVGMRSNSGSTVAAQPAWDRFQGFGGY
jgi:hypothetical protein